MLDSARDRGSDDFQLGVIAQVAESGRDVTFEEYSTGVYNHIECLESLGFRIDGLSTVDYNGQQLLELGYAHPDGWSFEQGEAAETDCRLQHLTFLDLLYQTNPTSSEYIDAQFRRALPTIIDCLEQYGYSVASDATIGEVAPLVIEVRDTYGDDADCYVASGFADALN